MGYFLALLNLVLAFVRVPEYFPELAPYRIIFWLGLVSLVISVFGLFVGRGQNPTFRARQIYLLLLFWLMIAFSVAVTGWLGGALKAFQDFAITATYFFLIVLNITSLKRVRAVAVVLVVASLIMVAQGVLALQTGYMADKLLYIQRLDRPPESLVMDESGPEPDDSESPYGGTPAALQGAVLRIRNIGFLNDPNDLAQVLLVSLPFLALAWRPGKAFRNILLVVLPGSFLLYGVYLTRSRGGVVGLAVMCLVAFRERLGKVRAGILTGMMVAGLLVLNIGGGRSLSDSSGAGRVEAWASGLLMLRQHPLFGVGFKNFMDEHPGLTAHNSFVLCFSELGLVGYFVWLTLLMLTFLELSAIIQLAGVERAGEDQAMVDLRRWARAAYLALITFLTAAFFLSRTYIMTLYLLLGLAVAIADVARRMGLQFTPSMSYLSKRMFAGVFGSIALIWFFVKLGSL